MELIAETKEEVKIVGNTKTWYPFECITCGSKVSCTSKEATKCDICLIVEEHNNQQHTARINQLRDDLKQIPKEFWRELLERGREE